MPVVEPGGSSLIEILAVALKSSIGVRAPVRLFVRPVGTVGLHGRFISERFEEIVSSSRHIAAARAASRSGF
jgi:hypothetical protein